MFPDWNCAWALRARRMKRKTATRKRICAWGVRLISLLSVWSSTTAGAGNEDQREPASVVTPQRLSELVELTPFGVRRLCLERRHGRHLAGDMVDTLNDDTPLSV